MSCNNDNNNNKLSNKMQIIYMLFVDNIIVLKCPAQHVGARSSRTNEHQSNLKCTESFLCSLYMYTNNI